MRSTYSAAVLAVLLSACSSSVPPDTAESLAADPARLRDVLAQCREGGPDIDERRCALAERVWRHRFMSERGARYTPGG